MGKYVATALIIAAVIMIGRIAITGDGASSLKTGITGVTSGTNAELSDVIDED